MFDDEMRRNPYPTYAQLRPERVMHFAPADLYLALDYETVEQLLTDHRQFSSNVSPSRNIRFEWLMFMDPPRHTRLRALVSNAFTPRSIAALEPRVLELVRALLDEAGDELEVVGELGTPLPMRIIAELLGVDEWQRLVGWSEAIFALGDTIVGDAQSSRRASEQFLAANAEMKDFFDRLLVERRARPREDLVTRLALAELDGERLGDEEILRFLQLLLAAGTETTTNLISNALLCLDEHPSEWRRLKQDLSLVPRAIEEVLRHRSPLQIVFRATRQQVELGGHTIPAGKMVLAVIGSANRDPSRFVDADRFDVTREGSAHLAFGHGIHFCLGAPLSRLEARVALGELFSRIDRFELTSKEPWSPRSGFHVHGPQRLPIRLHRR